MIKRSFAKLACSLTSAVWSIPAPEKREKGGEDAYFFNANVLAVADGVGGWASYGIDPAKYAWELIRNIECTVNSSKRLDPRAVMKEAAENSKETGSSTCCIVMLDPEEPKLYTANIGDSGFYLFRIKGSEPVLVYRSVSTVHGFNFPLQLGTNGDTADKAHVKVLDVQHSDVIVMFTDGVSDNLYLEQVQEIVKALGERPGLQQIKEAAEAIAEKAKKQSGDPKFESPFALESRKLKGTRWSGGKPDDITVLVSQINLN